MVARRRRTGYTDSVPRWLLALLVIASVAAAGDRTLASEPVGPAAATPDVERPDLVTVDLPPLAEGASVQVDGEVVEDPTTPRTLPPGAHLVCVHAPGGSQLQCWRRELAAGARVTLPPQSLGAVRARLTWAPHRAVVALELDGCLLRADLARLAVVEVDPGSHEVAFVGPAGARHVVSLEAPAGAEVSLHDLALRWQASVAPGGPGPGPWITLGVGAATLLTGVALLAEARGRHNHLLRAPPPGEGLRVRTRTQTEAQVAYDQASDRMAAGIALTAVGAAATVGGLTWYLVARLAAVEPATIPLTVAPTPNGLEAWVSF